MKVLLNTVEKVKKFCTRAMGLKNDVYVVSDRYKVDGKSLLGLFSLNLTNPVTVIIHEDDEEIAESVFYEFGV